MTIAINTAIKDYHEANRFFNIFVGEGLEGKKQHVQNVLNFTEKLLLQEENNDINVELLKLCAEHHDDGRVNQYELIGKFWDTKVSHNVMGLERFDKHIQNTNATVDDSIRIFRDCILYHGRPNMVSFEGSKPYVELITAADNFENACSAISYLLKEVKNDAKGYRHDHPELDQREASDFVFEHFSNGELFDKMKFCNTYAEYILFAATLATSCIKKYGAMAKEIMLQPAYGYSSILEGYKHVFEAVLDKETANRAYDIICNML